MRKTFLEAYIFICLYVVSQLQRTSAGQGKTEIASLKLKKILKTYDKDVRPMDDQGPDVVAVQVGVISLGPINNQRLSCHVGVYFKQWWKDPRLAIGGNESVTYTAAMAKRIWTPDTFFTSSLDGSLQTLTKENVRLKIWPDGSIYYSMRVEVEFQCDMDLRKFPFDKQTCTLRVESYAYTSKELVYVWSNNGSGVNPLLGPMKLEGYVLLGMKYESSDVLYSTQVNFSQVQAKFMLIRSLSYYLSQLFIPGGLLVFLTWGSFWIPKEAVPARIMLIVTNFLSTVVIMQTFTSGVIKTDYRTAMEYFLFINVAFFMLALVEYVLVLNVDNETIEKYLRCSRQEEMGVEVKEGFANGGFVHEEVEGIRKTGKDQNPSVKQYSASPGPKQKSKKLRKGHTYEQTHCIEKLVRILYPFLYILFLAGYFGNYYFFNNDL